MPKQEEYHLILRQMPDGEYSVLDGMPSEHKLKSMGAHTFEVPMGQVTVWMVDCNLSAAQVVEITQNALDEL